MEEVLKNKWRKLSKKIHRKDKVTWVHVARAFLYTWDNAVAKSKLVYVSTGLHFGAEMIIGTLCSPGVTTS